LSEGPANLGEFSEGEAYFVGFERARSILYGDLGAFWHGEMHFPEDDSSPVVAGPVSATFAQLPIEIEFAREAGAVTRVTATTASGNTYGFAVQIDDDQ
jgi:hypothetical protein